jgi:hypothetical protein
MQRVKGQPKSGTRAYARKYAKKNRKRLNGQAKDRMARFRERQRIAWAIVVKELGRLTPKSRAAVRRVMDN